MLRGYNRKEGFSLIESAIVLAVVGLVIGGIWVAAASVIETRKVNQTVSGLFVIMNRVSNLFPPTMHVPVTTYVDASQWPTFMRGADGFTLNGAGALIDSFGNTVTLGIGLSVSSSNGSGFFYSGPDLNKNLCMKLVRALTTASKDNSKIELIRIFKTASTSDIVPPFTQLPTSQCSGTLSIIAIYFTH